MHRGDIDNSTYRVPTDKMMTVNTMYTTQLKRATQLFLHLYLTWLYLILLHFALSESRTVA